MVFLGHRQPRRNSWVRLAMWLDPMHGDDHRVWVIALRSAYWVISGGTHGAAHKAWHLADRESI